MSERITFNPNQCGGRPCIRGMRIRVKDVLNLLAAKVPESEILEDYPVLEEADIGYVQLDDHMSALEGSIGVLPRRIMVASELIERARLALGNASLTINK